MLSWIWTLQASGRRRTACNAVRESEMAQQGSPAQITLLNDCCNSTAAACSQVEAVCFDLISCLISQLRKLVGQVWQNCGGKVVNVEQSSM